jgi:hypothetical protein
MWHRPPIYDFGRQWDPTGRIMVSVSTAAQQRTWRAQHGAETGKRGRRPVMPCGTPATYKRHLRRGDQACDACLMAAAEDKRWRRAGAVATRQDRNSLALGRAIAARLAADPEAVIAKGKANLAHMRVADPLGHARDLLDAWESLLTGPPDAVARVLTSLDPRSDQLRKNGPFAGVLDPEQRRRALERARR